MSLLSFVALALVLYFGWALIDPGTVKEIEERVAHSGTTPFGGGGPSRIRNGVGLVICLVVLVSSIYHDLRPIATATSKSEAPARQPLKPPSVEDKSVLRRIDNATLQKQIERQKGTSRGAAQPANKP